MNANPRSVPGSLDHEEELQCPVTGETKVASPMSEPCNLFPSYNL